MSHDHTTIKRVLFLGDINSPHTHKLIHWAKHGGFEVALFSLSSPLPHAQTKMNDIRYWFPQTIRTTNQNGLGGIIKKLLYIFALPQLFRIYRKFQPDLVHAHFATSYGMLAWILSAVRPYIVSVWGTDITVFPNKSLIHRVLIESILKGALKIAATSHFLANETRRYTNRDISITPFGLNVADFKIKPTSELKQTITLISTKSHEYIYGLDHIIEALKILKEKSSKFNYKLILVGDGSRTTQLKNLAEQLEVASDVTFTGRVDVHQIPELLRKADIAIFPTTTNKRLATESFGVAVIEAQATGIPVIVSRSGGLLELCREGETGFVLNNTTPGDIADKVLEIAHNWTKVANVVTNARQQVEDKYDFSRCQNIFLDLYAYT